MTAAQLKKALLRELDSRFGKVGLHRGPDKTELDRYYRSVPGGKHSIDLAVYMRRGSIELDAPYISVQLSAVEEFVARFEDPHPLAKPEDVAVRPTLGFRMEPKNFLAVFRKSWMVLNERDAAIAAEEFVPKVMKKAGPFWERFSDPAEVLRELLKGSEGSPEYSAGTPAMTAEKAVALALILLGPAKAREIAEAKLAVLKGEAADEVKRWVEKALQRTINVTMNSGLQDF